LPHLTLLVTRLPKGTSWWLPADDAIVLDDRLDRVERRCALEHELQHMLAGDCRLSGSPDAARLTARRESETDQRAACQLISLQALTDALVWALGFDEVAEALDVDVRTARARVLALTDDEKRQIEEAIARRDDAA
jgi:Zn-dependent peptidase ImmA (M78 family)